VKIDVEFDEFESGAVRNQDVIVKVSKPYLQFATDELGVRQAGS
jgi:hypothetical protein